MAAKAFISSRRKSAAVGAALLALSLGFGLFARSLTGGEGGSSSWKGYSVLLVDSSIPEAQVLAALASAGLKDVLSESTEPVLVSDWARLETMSLADARSRLLPGDPRLDSYLLGLGAWFEARGKGKDAEYRVFYLREPSPYGSRVDKAARAALGEFQGRFLLPDSASSPRPKEAGGPPFAVSIILLLTGAFAGPLLGRAKGRRRSSFEPRIGGRRLDRLALRLSILLPWAVLASGGLFAAALAVLWGLAALELADGLDLPLDEYRRSGKSPVALSAMFRQGRPPLVLPIVALVSCLLSVSILPSVCLALAGSLAAALGYALLPPRYSSRARFVPLPIGQGGGRVASKLRRPAQARAALAALALCALALARVMGPSTPTSTASAGSVSYPLPTLARGSQKPGPAEARARASAEIALPGLASALIHRATQEAIPYMPVGEERPDPFAPVIMPEPDTASPAPSLVFDEAWARSAYNAISPISVEGMLLGQGGATIGRVSESAFASSGPLAPIDGLLYIFLLVPLLGSLLVGLPSINERNAASGEIRQEA